MVISLSTKLDLSQKVFDKFKGLTMMSLDSDRWLEAMKSEIGSMYENKVWTLVELPDDRQSDRKSVV